MNLYPRDIYDKVEFDRILTLLKEGVLGHQARRAIDEISLSADLNEITKRLDRVAQFIKAGSEGQDIPLFTYESVLEDVPLLKKIGYVLDIDAIRRIYNHIHQAKNLQDYFHAGRAKSYDLLYDIYKIIHIDPTLLKEIDRVLDEKGEVRPDASPELLKVSRAIRSKERELDNLFANAVKKYAGLGYLADTTEGLRNGRRVLTVTAENKRRIDGVIHDESATGKTVYIEPAEVMQTNNEVFNLYTEHKKEVYKVLRELCNQIRPYADELVDIEKVLVTFDVIQSKAKLAKLMDGERPQLVNRPHFGFKNAHNPVLLLKNNEANKSTISFNLELKGVNRILVLSGPNAGGKSVTMKSVGLIQIMLQFGLLVPVAANSTLGIFKKIYSDIGDQQSLEDDLSTYSSRLKNMKVFLDDADNETLILIDEFGSGTDPKIGGAIAEAILRQLNFQKCFGVITTHYSNLKYFAFKAKGILNGSMEFDKSLLAPTYQLIVGKPGSSFAYEIAEKSGIHKKVLSYARHKTGKNEKAIDELLTNLQSEKKEVVKRMEKLLEKEDKLERMIKSYNELHKELEFRRKKMKVRAKEAELIKVSEDNRALEKVIREIKETNKIEDAKAIAKVQKEKRAKVQNEISSLYDDIYNEELHTVNGVVEVGSYVKMRNGEQTGKVISINKKKAIVEMGFMQITVKIDELISVGEPIKRRTKSINTEMVDIGSKFSTTIDIRGYLATDADWHIQDFLDKALLNNASHLKIIHGEGSGVLRKLVLKKLKEYKDVRKVSHAEPDYGGLGVTLVEM